MRVGMRDRLDLVGGDRLRAFAGFLQDRDQLVLRFIVERILQPLLDFTTVLGRMFDIPPRGLRDRLNRRNQIAVAQLCLDLNRDFLFDFSIPARSVARTAFLCKALADFVSQCSQ